VFQCGVECKNLNERYVNVYLNILCWIILEAPEIENKSDFWVFEKCIHLEEKGNNITQWLLTKEREINEF
jgi:hypothetical protein